MAFVTETGKTYRVTSSDIDAWLDYTPPGSDPHDPGQSNNSAGFSLAGCLVTVVEQSHRIEEGYPKTASQFVPYEVVKVTVEGHQGNYYAWVVYEGVVKIVEYAPPPKVPPEQPPPPPGQPSPGQPPPEPPPPPGSLPGDVQIEVHAGQTVVVEVKSITIAGVPKPLPADPVANAVRLANDLKRWQDTTPWTGLDKDETANRIISIIKDPDTIQQGCLNLCGPAAFLRMWIPRDPEGFAKAATGLFKTGSGNIGSLEVKADADLMKVNYAALKAALTEKGLTVPPTADWMVMGSIRGGSNWCFDYEGEPVTWSKPSTWTEAVAAITPPSDLVRWLHATGLYRSIENRTSLFGTQSVDEATKLNPTANGDQIALLINGIMLDPSPDMLAILVERFPSHWLVLRTKPQVVEQSVTIEYFCWGERGTRTVLVSDFNSKFYGAIIASP